METREFGCAQLTWRGDQLQQWFVDEDVVGGGDTE